METTRASCKILILEEIKSKRSRYRHWNRWYCVIEEHYFPSLKILHVSIILDFFHLWTKHFALFIKASFFEKAREHHVECANTEYALFFRTFCTHCSSNDKEIEKASLLSSHWTGIVGDLVHVEYANLRMDSYPIEPSFFIKMTGTNL